MGKGVSNPPNLAWTRLTLLVTSRQQTGKMSDLQRRGTHGHNGTETHTLRLIVAALRRVRLW